MSFARPPGPPHRFDSHAGPVRPTVTTARLTTSIWFDHWAGRVYPALVLIPHMIIVRHTMRGLR